MKKFTLKQLEKAIKDTRKCTKSDDSNIHFELEQSKNEVELELMSISHFHVVPDIIFRLKKRGK
jgi:hypothetical protein